jgi:ERCC4-type nuclease
LSNDHQEIVFEPGTFQIVMRERHSSDDRTYIRDKFIEYGVQIDARQLELGDVMWIAKRGNDELVLDCIVERKRADDLPHRLSGICLPKC